MRRAIRERMPRRQRYVRQRRWSGSSRRQQVVAEPQPSSLAGSRPQDRPEPLNWSYRPSEISRGMQTARSAALGPRHRADEVGGDQRAVAGIPRQDGVCLGQRNQRSHRCGAGGYHVLLVVLRHDHDFEPAISPLWSGDPVGVEDLHPSRLLACTRHDLSRPDHRSRVERIRDDHFQQRRVAFGMHIGRRGRVLRSPTPPWAAVSECPLMVRRLGRPRVRVHLGGTQGNPNPPG
jgi:hypothetical protein